MEIGTTLKDLLCEVCRLQFNKKSIYDMHVSIVHEGVVNKVTEEAENSGILVENENKPSVSNILQNIVSEDSTQSEDIIEGD